MDAAKALLGDVFLWREWKLNNPRRPLLQSIGGTDYLWEGPVNESQCFAAQARGHVPGISLRSHPDSVPVPAPGCTCGFWGYATLEDFLAAGVGGLNVHPIVGLIRGYGEYVAQEFGMRVRFARPELLLVMPHHFVRRPEPLEAWLRDLYQCEVQYVDVQPFYTEQCALLDSDGPGRRFPCIVPPVDLTRLTMPMAEVGDVDWNSHTRRVADTPRYRNQS